MTVVLTGHDLTRDEVVRVARGGEPVALDADARARMAATPRDRRRRSRPRGGRVRHDDRASGVLKRVGVAAADAADYSSGMLAHHLVGQGPDAPPDVVRATILRLANHFAESSPGVRPELADRLIAALNDGEAPRIHAIGSVGSADLAPLAELASVLFDGMALEPGEGTALLDNNAFATGWAALAVADAEALLDALDVAGALSLDGFAANPTMLHPAIGAVRPYPGLQATLARLTDLLAGSAIHDPGVARNLQDPLTFRNLPQIHGAARDVLAHVDGVLAIELNASQGNPIVVPSEGRIVSVANFEILPLAAALDYLRIVLATALTTATERVVKALYPPWSGLPTGLVPGGRDVTRRLDVPEPRRPESGGGSPPPRRTRLVRAGLDRPRRRDRGPDDDGAADGAAPRGDGRDRRHHRGDRAGGRRPGAGAAGSPAGRGDRQSSRRGPTTRRVPDDGRPRPGRIAAGRRSPGGELVAETLGATGRGAPAALRGNGDVDGT